MNILVVGGGGREHTIIRKLRENPEVKTIYALPGNGGIAQDATCVPISATAIDDIVKFASENAIDFAVVAPDDPLAMGCVDRLHAIGIPCFGPEAKAAQIEASKVFSKNLMKKYGIPTARYETFSDADAAISYIRQGSFPIVIKADGLALGKGVLICEDEQAAVDGVRAIMLDKRFGDSGNHIVVEEFLEGPEVSVLAFTDGKVVKPMVSSMDHKRAGDHDTGLNTGGMGTIAPNPYYTPAVAERCMREIFLPTIAAMNAEGRTFRGCLYFGLMITKDGPKVIEYNCRFGDPETQVVLPLLKSDLFEVMRAVEEERLASCPVVFSQEHACCVVLASEGYPQAYQTGFPFTVDPDFDAQLYCAGVKKQGNALVTGGGRVAGVTACAPTLRQAIEKAYLEADKVHFANRYMRHDVGARALKGEA